MMYKEEQPLGWEDRYPDDCCGSIPTGGPGSYAWAPDFEGANPRLSNACYRGQVSIPMSGSYYRDFKNADAAAAAAGYQARTKLWTWHHVYDMHTHTATGKTVCSMQLVSRDLHNRTKNHYGAVHQWQVAGKNPSYRLSVENFFLSKDSFLSEDSFGQRIQTLTVQELELLERELGWRPSPLWEKLLAAQKEMLDISFKIQYEGEEGPVPADGITPAEVTYIMNKTDEGKDIKEKMPNHYPFAQDVFGNSIIAHQKGDGHIYLVNHETGGINEINIEVAQFIELNFPI